MKRSGISNLRYLLVAAAGVVLIVGGIFLFAPSRSADKGEPNIGVLKEVLERSAEDALPVPSVSDDEIVLNIDSSRFDSEIERVIGIAQDMGGTALRSGDEEILAQIPVRNVSEFHARVTGKEPRESNATGAAEESNQLIVVSLRQHATAYSSKPEPSP
jgi:hypothetical protein